MFACRNTVWFENWAISAETPKNVVLLLVDVRHSHSSIDPFSRGRWLVVQEGRWSSWDPQFFVQILDLMTLSYTLHDILINICSTDIITSDSLAWKLYRSEVVYTDSPDGSRWFSISYAETNIVIIMKEEDGRKCVCMCCALLIEDGHDILFFAYAWFMRWQSRR